MNSELQKIFYNLKSLLAKYQKLPLTARIDRAGRYEMWSEKPGIIVNGKPRKDIFFASIIIQSNYVGFYFMPVYTDGEHSTVFSEELLKLLKGKSCFHIKKLDNNLITDIESSIEAGYKIYKKRNWI